jgi:hypothetical protein
MNRFQEAINAEEGLIKGQDQAAAIEDILSLDDEDFKDF